MITSTTINDEATTRALPQPLTAVCAGLVLVGIAAFGYGLVSDPQTAWLSFHANFLYYAALSQGGVVLACIFVIVGARWVGPVRRIAEGLGAWVPISLVLGCIGYFGGDYLFAWQRDGVMAGKEAWLNETRFYLTDIGILAVLTLLSLAFLRASVRPTLKKLADSGTGFAGSMAQRWTAGWKGDEEERAAALVTTNRLAPGICLLFAVGYTFLVFDQVMSMEQSWFSNLFGAYVSWGGILTAVAACCVVAVLHRNAPGLEGQIDAARLHDLGKMLFAFSIFWMYLFFAQYLVIYYGGLPEETQYYYDRLGPQFLIDKGFSDYAWQLAWVDWDWSWDRLNQAYGWLSMVAWVLNWILPFWVLLGEKPKKTPWILGPVAGLLLLGFWFERNLLVWPSVVKDGQGGLAALGPIQLGIAAGFLGAFVLVYLVYTRVFPGLAATPPSESD